MNKHVIPPATNADFDLLSTRPLKRVDSHMFNPQQFLEQLNFSPETPYTIRRKSFPYNELVPLHYASSVEIILAEDLDGTVIIGQTEHRFRPRDVVFIPPYTVHSTNVKACGGVLTGIKLDEASLSRYLQLSALLESCNLSWNQIASVHDCFDGVAACTEHLIQDDGNLLLCARHILDLVTLLTANAVSTIPPVIHTREGKSIYDVIRWTNEHYMENITIERAAEQLHFSKSYFCKYFKSVARMTYLTYLNQVRVNHATRLLKQGYSVAEAAEACGYTNISYFINLFRQINGCTPGKYLKTRL